MICIGGQSKLQKIGIGKKIHERCLKLQKSRFMLQTFLDSFNVESFGRSRKETKAEETTTESGNAQCILTIFMKFEHLYNTPRT